MIIILCLFYMSLHYNNTRLYSNSTRCDKEISHVLTFEKVVKLSSNKIHKSKI